MCACASTEALCKRLADPVKDVRLHALKAFEVAASSDAVDKVAAMPVALFTAVADRLLDKQVRPPLSTPPWFSAAVRLPLVLRVLHAG